MISKLGIILNGPPGCGKDTIANCMVEKQSRPYIKRQFKDALYAFTAKHFEVDLDKFIHYASDRTLKDSCSLAGLGGRTPRQALIHVSEDILKPRYGNDFFGQVEAGSLRECAGRNGGIVNVIYPDGGFTDEVMAVGNELDSLIIIRLHRNGFSFEGDSRNYIHLPDTEKRLSVDINLADGEINKAVHEIQSWVDRYLWINK